LRLILYSKKANKTIL